MSLALAKPLDPARDVLLGTPGSRTELVWYVDYSRRLSRQARAIMLRVVGTLDPGVAVLAIRQAPSRERAPSSEWAARAALAAATQGRFLDMHQMLFEHQDSFDESTVLAFAARLELDEERFGEDLTSKAVLERVEEDRADAPSSVSASSLFIDDRLYTGAWDEDSLSEALEKPLGVRVRLAASEFFHWAAGAGVVLIVATVLALLVTNLGGHESYERLRDTLIGLSFGEHALALPLEAWINDGLMAIFFLLVGIEIKREIVDGELSDLSSAALPVVAALGGMLVPALVFTALNWGRDSVVGWGVPMATDIAFTLGLMALLGRRVPLSLKVFVSALAVVDDLGAIVVIGLFYSDGISFPPLLWAALIGLGMFLLNRWRVYARTPYLLLGLLLWVAVHSSGLHATLAGVLTACAIPSRRSGNLRGVAAQTSAIFEAELRDARASDARRPVIRSGALATLENALDRLREPGYHLQSALENWSNFLILPLFAFFNTGLLIAGSGFSLLAPPTLGVMAGLVLGKPIGIVLAAWLAVRTGLATLSPDIGWLQVIGAGCLAGVGFTMSIFIGSAAFDGAELESVKLATLLASSIAALLGMAVLLVADRASRTPDTHA